MAGGWWLVAGGWWLVAGSWWRGKPAPRNIRVALLLMKTTEVFNIEGMNSKQMKKWLEQQGATFQPGRGSYLKVILNGRQTTLPMHGAAELGKGLEAAIKRQLGLK